MSEVKVMLEIEETVATVTLNRPAKLNAIDPDMLRELAKAIRQLDENDQVRVVLLTGAGERAFSVGADIHAWSALAPLDMWRRWIRDGHRVFNQLANLRQPVIAALSGFAFGGGLELALAADIRLAGDGAELALPEVRLATVPGWTGSQRLPALIGASRAKQMVFSGARVDASTAEGWGLVNEVIPAEGLLARARELALEIAQNAPLAVQVAKQLVNGALGFETGSTLEALAGGLAASTEDAREGVAAFIERREPKYTGR